MRRNLARSRALLLLLIATLLLSPALVATSAEAAAKAPYRVGIKLSDTNVAAGTTVRVSGKVRPLTTGKVKVQRRVSGNWTTLKRVRLVASSYATTVRFNEPGVAFLRVVAPASKGNRKGTSRTRTVRVLNHATNPQIATATLPNGTVGTAYSATVSTADGRPGTWSIGSGALPPGLTIAPATGVISGTPTATGSSQFGVYFRDRDARVAAKVFNVSIAAAEQGPVISTTTLPGATVGTAYTAQLQTVGNVSGTWTLSTGTLPAGLSLNAASGVISGTPTTVGTSAFTVQFKDSANRTATKQLSIAVAAADQLIVTASLPNGVRASAYTAQLQSRNNVAGTWSISQGLLPPGLSLNNGTGAITGTPTANGKSDFTVRFQDAAGNVGTRALSITITEPGTGPVIATTALPNGVAGVAYETRVHTVDGRAGTWSLAAGTLPPGLTLTASTGVISGTPTAAAIRDFTVRFTDNAGSSVVRDFSIIIEATAPEITTVALPSAVRGVPYSQALETRDSRAGYWDISQGVLPPGLNLNTNTGVISGTPTNSATYRFTVRFRDTLNVTDTQDLAIAVTESQPVIATSSLPVGTVGTPYSATLATADNRAGTWSISTGSLPAGLTLAPATGVISGTPTTREVSDFVVKFKDANNLEATKPLSIRIQSCFLIFCS